MSDPIELFIDNSKEVKALIAIHEEKTGKNPGRRSGVEILNKSGIVLLTACWEAFIEDAASTAFRFMLEESADPKQLPKGVLKRVAAYVKKDVNELRVWDLSRDGWKQVLRDYRDEILRPQIGIFNSPKAGNVDRLFDALLDLPELSKNWHWQGMGVEAARTRLKDYVELRGAIAHRVKASRSVYKGNVSDYAEFITRLAVRSANVVRKHVSSLVRKYPWEAYHIGSFR
ncbi:MAG: HEPN domain-containing protein [Phycisphaerales bacterium]